MLYDHPPAQFQSMTLEKKHELYYKLSQDFPELLRRDHEENQFESTQFTYKDIEGNVHLRSDRPGILISSTSWTPDEDFSILLNALESEFTIGKETKQKKWYNSGIIDFILFFSLRRYSSSSARSLSTYNLYNNGQGTTENILFRSNRTKQLEICYNYNTMAIQ